MRVWAGVRTRPEWWVAATLLVLLVATSANYGFHRDELYFIVAGQHPDYGYPDQPLLTPLIAQGLFWLGHGSIVVVRLAGSLASAFTVVVVGWIADLLGASPRGRLIAAVAWAVSAMALVTGHMLSTTTLDVLAAGAVTYCLIRAVVRDQPRWVMIAGAVLGAGLLNKLLVAIVIGIVMVAFLAIGPRRVFLTRYSLWGILFAAIGVAPYVVWQALHGWPQLAVSRAIAQSGAQGGSLGVIPYQFLLVSPVLVAVLIAGIVRTFRTRPVRPIAVAYLALLVFLIVSSGKAYYAAGLYPALIASGAIAADVWITRGTTRLQGGLVTAALAVALATNAVIGLSILPPRLLTATGIETLNSDAGEQVGWPALVGTVDRVYRRIPASERAGAVIFTSNYGEAGALDVYGASLGLPSAFSGHNGFSLWGPPRGNGPVILVGVEPSASVRDAFTGCRVVARIDNGIGLDNDEQGEPVQLCTGPAHPWSELWPHLVHFD